MLVQLKKQRVEDKRHVLVHFSADIKKGPPGEGFGMVVNVDDRHNIFVKKVLSCIVMGNATHNAHGEVRVGDEILGIDGESTAGWTLARLVQRLNDFRVPVGSTVVIMFQRRIKLPDDKANILDGQHKGVEGLLEPDDEEGLRKDEQHMQDMASLPAEEQTIPEAEEEKEAHPLAAQAEEFMKHQHQMEMLQSTNENETLRLENERLAQELEETKRKLEMTEKKREEVEMTLQETINKTEEYFVSQTRIDDAINKTTNAGEIPEGGAWEVPEKLELMDVNSAEKLIEVEHRLLKMGLRVEGDPSEQREEAFADHAKSMDALQLLDPEAAFKNIQSNVKQSTAYDDEGYGDEYGGEYKEMENPVDVFEHHDEDDEDEDEEHRLRMARVGRGISFHINDPDYVPGEKEEPNISFENQVDHYVRRKSRMQKTQNLSTLWNQTLKTDRLSERKRRESNYGHGETFKNEFKAKKVSPTVNMVVEGILKPVPAANNRLITAKDRIKIHDELDPKKPQRKSRGRSKSPSKRSAMTSHYTASYDRSFSPSKAHNGMSEKHLEELGFRTQQEDPRLLARLAENAEKLKMNDHRIARHSPSKRLKEKDKLFVKKLLKKRIGGGGTQ